MPTEKRQLQVSNNEAESRFECDVDGKVGVVEYTTRPGAIVFTHTEVPRELAGRGIAQQLVAAALDHARENKLHVVPLCTYVAAYIEKHPEYKDLVE
ncbi:MAG TPA: GNAT family N-acetyltransferase [Thermoanaerobaculia bacterium]